MNKNQWSLSDGKSAPFVLTSGSHAIQQLERVNHMGKPVIVGVDSGVKGPGFLVGLAGSLAFVNYSPTGNIPPYYTLVSATVQTDSTNVMVFDYAGGESEIDMKYCVPIEWAYRIVEHFLDHGELLPEYVWEQD
jgi:Immunity protein Imm1